MAEGIKKLKEQLTCPVCLSQYTEPVILPCHHVFCKSCIQEVDKKSKIFSCPTCRRESNRDKTQKAFTINTLKDTYEKLKEERNYVSLACSLSDQDAYKDTQPVADHTCARHRAQSLDLYCQDCSVLVCRDCLLDKTDQQHSDHSYTYVNTLGAEYRTKFSDRLTAMKELGERLKAAEDTVSQEKLKLDKQEAEITKATTESFEALIELLKEEMENTLSQLSTVMTRKRTILVAQEQTFKAAIHEVYHEMQQLSTVVTTSTDQDIINSCLIEKTDSLIETMEMLSFEPLEAADIGGVTPIDSEALRKLCRAATPYYIASAAKTRLEGDGLKFAWTNKVAYFGVKLHDAYGDACLMPQAVVVQLKALRNGLVTDANVTIDSVCPSCYVVTYEVETCGRYDLNILVNGQHIPDSPLSLHIKKPVHQTWTRCVEISNLQKPTRLAIVGEMLYVSEYGANRISIFNSKLEKIRNIENIPGPGKITFDHDCNAYVCASTDHKVYKIAPDDTSVASVGGKGRSPGTFNIPNGTCFHNQKLYVCDSENYRIKVYDSDLNLLDIHDKKVLGPKKYKFPCDLAVDSDGMIYLVDGQNHRINVFDENWKPQRIIGKRGTGPGELQNPVCIHIDEDDQIFVTEYDNNRISVFTTSGQFLASFGQRYLINPEGLTVDQDGFVYVSHYQYNVLIFC